MSEIHEYSYAKLNLFLKVTSKNSNGYHNLQMINIPLSFCDDLSFYIADKDEVITNVDLDDNIIYKAMSLFKEKYQIKECVKVVLTKRIPLGSGLGGGSGNAAATLRGLNRLFGLNILLSELEPLAISLGSDVLFCLYNKASYVYGIGDKLVFLPPNQSIKSVLLIFPPLSASTKKVFENHIIKKNNNDMMFRYLSQKQLKKRMLFNDLTITSIKLYKELRRFIRFASMSGSGSSFFIINPHEKDKVKLDKMKINYLITTPLQ